MVTVEWLTGSWVDVVAICLMHITVFAFLVLVGVILTDVLINQYTPYLVVLIAGVAWGLLFGVLGEGVWAQMGLKNTALSLVQPVSELVGEPVTQEDIIRLLEVPGEPFKVGDTGAQLKYVEHSNQIAIEN